jgi:DNA processing protein
MSPDAPLAAAAEIDWNDPRYPAWLRMVPDPPPVLWVRGDVTAFEPTSIAIVGSRSASQYAKDVARQLAAGLAAEGIVVTSGMARGVDGAAHEACLAAGGRTIAVLGTGIDVTYPPEHAGLAARIAARGLLVSEMPPGTLPWKSNFPRRNRIISGLSRAVVIVEASEKSGSLITARMALEQGREVMAVPGSVLYGRNRGAHALIKDGAMPVESAADILGALGLAGTGGQDCAGCAHLGTFDNPVEAALHEAGASGLDLDGLAKVVDRDPETLLRDLTSLELDGRAERLAGGRYVWVGGKG